jgi:hypothetical protein
MPSSKELRDIMSYAYIVAVFSLFIFLFLLFSCKPKRSVIPEKTKVDTLIEKSMKLNDSSIIVLKLADRKTEILVQNTINKVNELEQTNQSLKSQIDNIKNVTPYVKTNTIIIRDTIYITEKKNFWGKKKITIDSSASEFQNSDTTINEN